METSTALRYSSRRIDITWLAVRRAEAFVSVNVLSPGGSADYSGTMMHAAYYGVMAAKDANQRVLDALSGEIRKRRGHIGKIESLLGRDQGYLSKVCSGKRPITVAHLLEVLEALDVDAGDFFARALDVVPDVDRMLESMARRTKDAGLQRLERATRRLEAQYGEGNGHASN